MKNRPTPMRRPFRRLSRYLPRHRPHPLDPVTAALILDKLQTYRRAGSDRTVTVSCPPGMRLLPRRGMPGGEVLRLVKVDDPDAHIPYYEITLEP